MFFNNHDSLSFFTFFSPYMPHKNISDDYKVTMETATSQNPSSFTMFSSPLRSTTESQFQTNTNHQGKL